MPPIVITAGQAINSTPPATAAVSNTQVIPFTINNA